MSATESKDNEQVIQQIIVEKKLTYSIPEAAKVLGISENTMRQLARIAGFPAFTIGSRLLVSIKGLDAWVDEQARRGVQL